MSGAKHFRDGTSPEHPHGAGVETSHTFRDRCEDITSILGHLSSQAAKLIDSHEVFDESVHNQSTALREAGNIRANDRIKVGIVGASEMGKSSTLNALIHQKDLCKTVRSLSSFAFCVANTTRTPALKGARAPLAR